MKLSDVGAGVGCDGTAGSTAGVKGEIGGGAGELAGRGTSAACWMCVGRVGGIEG